MAQPGEGKQIPIPFISLSSDSSFCDLGLGTSLGGTDRMVRLHIPSRVHIALVTIGHMVHE